MSEPFVVVDEAEFFRAVPRGARLRRLADGFRFTEGPVWMGGFLLFSDIPADRIYRWSEADGIGVFREPSRNANGNCRDSQGRLLTCEHGTRRVTRSEPDGTVVTLAEFYDGGRLNSPNDLVSRPDGSVWFTDPVYGLGKRPPEQAATRVYRIAPDGRLAVAAEGFDQPNGLCFSPDGRTLYVADSGAPRHIKAFGIDPASQALLPPRVFATIDTGVPDGIRCDRQGRLWSSAGDGVHIFMPDGRLIGRILVPETTANLCFGGEGHRTLFMTARTGLYAMDVLAEGAA